MILYKKVFLFFCFLLLYINLGSAQEAHEGALKWKMAFLKKSGAAYESILFRNALSVAKRDLYQLYLGFDTKSYCYIIHEDDEGKLPLVYRKNVSPGDKIILPGDDRDFLAAEFPGTSRFYVIVSSEPRQNLERLIEQSERRNVTANASSSLERSILSEVLAVRRNVSSFQDIQDISSPPGEGDPAMRGELYLFDCRDIMVVTVTVRVQ